MSETDDDGRFDSTATTESTAASEPTETTATSESDGTDDETENADSSTADAEAPFTFDDLAVVMGTYNEEEAVGTVLEDIERVTDGCAEVVCVDGSDDRTPEIAREHGATVIEQEPQGYGVAVREAVLTPDRPVVVTTDCDDTYPMDALPRFLEKINEGYDVVSGDRLHHGAEAMPAFNRLGNHTFAAVASVLMGTRVHDTTTGMRAYRRDVLQDIVWTTNTALSAELLIRPAMRGYRVVEIPIEYGERAGETKLDPIQGGWEIGTGIVKVCLEERVRHLFD
jgi:glycosyltransferase involved in cell wall biosynthesis